MVLAGVMNDVPPYNVVHADGGGKAGGVLCGRVIGCGINVMMACWNAWRLSDSLSSPHTLCSSFRLVTREPFSLYFDESFGRAWMSVLMWWSLVFRALER
jgi:hypothetical protein